MKTSCTGWDPSTYTRVAKPAHGARVVDLAGAECMLGPRRKRQEKPVIAKMSQAVALGVSTGMCVALWGVIVFMTARLLN